MARRLAVVITTAFLVACSLQGAPGDKENPSRALQLSLNYLAAHEREFGLNAPGMELRVAEEVKPVKGQRTKDIKFAQYYRGVEIHGGGVSTHVDVESGVVTITDFIVRSIMVDPVPEVTASSVVDEAVKRVAPAKPLEDPKAALLILAKGYLLGKTELMGDVLVWYVPVTTESGGREDFYFNAHSGALIWSYDATARARSFFSWSNSQTYGMFAGQADPYTVVDTHAIPNSSSTWTYYLQSPCTGVNVVGVSCRDFLASEGIPTRSPGVRGNWVGDAGNGTKTTGTPFTSPTTCTPYYYFCEGAFGDFVKGSANRATAGADVYFSMEWVLSDILTGMFNRWGLDGKDGKTYMLVHYGSGFVDATWCDSCNAGMFGDGNAAAAVTPTYPFVPLDIVGHEMGHGLDNFTTKLDRFGESGGILESNADILGTIAELKYYEGAPEPAANYFIGERVFKENWVGGVLVPTRALRSMPDPGMDGHSQACWSSSIASLQDVHYIAGPSNHMFWLLANGGTSKCIGSTVSGIGWREAAQIWYRALSGGFIKSTTNYHALRQAYLDASSAVYGLPSIQTSSVSAAFAGIGLP